MRARNRVSVTLPSRVMAALEVLAEKNGIGTTTQARILLRQALSRTMETPEAKARAAPSGLMTRKEWIEERSAIAADLAEDERAGQ